VISEIDYHFQSTNSSLLSGNFNFTWKTH